MYIQEFRKSCEIAGFKGVRVGNIEGFLEAVNKETSVVVEMQFFDADMVATWRHLYFALLDALMAFKNGENLSKTVTMETMLCASARRQIQKAMQLLGIKPTSSNMAVLIVGEKPEAVQKALEKISTYIAGLPDDSVLELSKKKIERIKTAFEISEVELETVMEGDSVEEALVDLVLERAALLATGRSP